MSIVKRFFKQLGKEVAETDLRMSLFFILEILFFVASGYSAAFGDAWGVWLFFVIGLLFAFGLGEAIIVKARRTDG